MPTADASYDAQSLRALNQIREQRRKWAVRVTQPLLLCSQIQRSGGTLLLRLFDGHPCCFTHPNELRWGRPKGWPSISLSDVIDARRLFSHVSEGWPTRFARHGYAKDLQHVTAAGAADSARLPFLFDGMLQLEIFTEALPATIARQRDVLDAYLTSLFNAWLDYQRLYDGPKRWVTAFEPRFLARRDGGPEVFFADYSDGMLVTIVREPGAWLSSYRRHIPSHTTEKALRLWTDSLEAGVRAHAKWPDRVLVLLFDDLIHRTEKVMRSLCDRMDIPFERSLLTPTFNSMDVLSNSSHSPARGIDPLVTGRHHLSREFAECEQSVAKASARYDEVRASFRVN
jgi:hypothetical protein